MADTRRLNVGLWAAQVLLAVLFGASGAFKTFTPLAELAAKMPWVNDAPAWVPRLAGVSELLGVAGLLLPSLTRVLPKLTAAAAAGLVVVMVLAAGLHGMRGEFGGVVANVILGAAAAFVVWGRLVAAPIAPRGSSLG